MSYSIIQADDELQFVSASGAVSTLALPAGVTLDTDRPPRFAIINRYVVVVNTPNVPLTVDGAGIVRPLAPAAPVMAPTVAIGSAGSLSGTYSGIRYTYIIEDAAGNIIAESSMSPPSGSVTVTNDKIAVSGIGISADTQVTARRIYRTTSNGSTLFKWFDLDGNTLTSFEDDLPDAALSLIAAPTLGTPPRLTHVKEWRNRLWGRSDLEGDNLRFSEPDAWWSWPVTNALQVPILGGSDRGIIALMPRREVLGIGKRDVIWSVVGNTPTDFRLVKLAETCGVESQESCASYRDTVWWLWKDGVYQWNAEGIKNISDGKVKSWFTKDDTFNRDMFDQSFALFDPTTLKYRLFLASAGSTVIDRWVEYDIQTGNWWGPHKTLSFDPTCSYLLFDDSDKIIPAIGSDDAFIWQPRIEATDHIADGIEFDMITGYIHNDSPDLEKYHDHLIVQGKAQSSGEIIITPFVGEVNATAGTPITYDMAQGREKLPRLGRGKIFRLQFQHSKYNEPVEIHGIENLFAPFGRR